MWGNCHTVLKKTPPLFRSDLLNVKTSHNVETEQTVFYKVRLQSGQSGAEVHLYQSSPSSPRRSSLLTPSLAKGPKCIPLVNLHPPSPSLSSTGDLAVVGV